MPKFITIGYGDRAGYDQTDDAVLAAAHAHDQSLLERGAVMGIAGAPVQVRNTDGAGTAITEGAFLRADLPIAGFSLIEADSIEHAAELVSGSPCAVAQGVVEVWPLETTPS